MNDFIVFLSYVAVFFIGALTLIAALGYGYYRDVQKRKVARRAEYVKEQLDNLKPKTGPILN